MNQQDSDARARVLTPRFCLLLFAQAFFGLAFSTYFLIPKYLQVELAATPGTIGWVSGAAWTTTVLCVPVTGSLVDRIGRRRFAVTGAVAMVLGCALFAYTSEVGALLLFARVLQGVGFSFFYVAASTMAADFAPPARLSQAIGWFGATIVMTNAISPAVAEPLAERFGWQAIFLGTAGFAGIAGLAASQLPGSEREAEPASAPLREALGVAALRPVWAVSAIAGLLFGAVITFAPPWALDSGFDQVRHFFVAYALASASVRFTLGGLADSLGRFPVAIAAMALYGGVPLLLVEVSWSGLVLPGIALGIAQGLYYPALNAAALDWGEARIRGSVMALYNGAFNLGFTLGSVAMGPIVEAVGYPWMFRGVAASALLAIVLMRRMALGSAGRG